MRRAIQLILFTCLLCHAQPRIRFDASPTSVDEGDAVTLRWQVRDAVRVRIEPGNCPNAASGDCKVVPTRTTTFTLTAIDSQGRERTAEVEVTVHRTKSAATKSAPKKKMGLSRPTGRELLLKGRPEAPGYGLYSYLLFGSRPTQETRPQYLAVLRAVLLRIPEIEDLLTGGVNRDRLNILYIPVTSAVSIPDETPESAAEAILSAFDFPRAALLLATVGPRYNKGCYFISRLRPISASQAIERPYLFQDLSRAAPTMAAEWVRYFQSQTARDEPWNEDRAKALALTLRNGIENITGWGRSTTTAIAWIAPGPVR
ncbi:MAG: hypothetical protein JNN08_03245 [Bryobacterales bacterium]|nr:hypothetical protein [Bryobacterales bacterium]